MIAFRSDAGVSRTLGLYSTANFIEGFTDRTLQETSETGSECINVDSVVFEGKPAVKVQDR